MKKIIYLLMLCFYVPLLATNYYVSNSGNDSNDGLSEQTAWKSLTKVNAEMENFSPGDFIAFKAGDKFFGKLDIIKVKGNSFEKIIFGSYGNGEKPVITGGKAIVNWTPSSGNVYRTKISEPVYQVFKNNKSLSNSRFPKNDFFNITSVSGQTKFTSKDLIGSHNLIGATIIIYPYVWYVQSVKIIAFDSGTGTVTIENKGIYNIGEGNPFFILNHEKLLNDQNEWSYDDITQMLYIYSSNKPVDIFASLSKSYGIQLRYSSYISIKDINIKYVNEKGIWVESSSNIIIENNTIEQSYEYGIYTRHGSNIEVKNNIIIGSNQTALHGESDNLIFEGNHIYDTGLANRITYKGFSQPYGIEVLNSKSTVRNNEIINSGYIGIRFYGDNCLIENNFIEDFCLTLHDGGAIYTYNSSYNDIVGSGTIIRNNIIIGSKSVNPEWSIFGIYLDDRSHDIVANANTITNTRIGIFLHNTKRQNIKNNNIYNTISQGIGLQEDSGGGNGEMIDNIVVGNEIFMKIGDLYNYPLLLFSEFDNHNFGSFNSNKYYNPFSKKNIGVHNKTVNWFNVNQPKSMNLLEWQTFSGQDLNSEENDFIWDSYFIDQVVGSNLIANGEFNKDLSKWSSYNAEITRENDGNSSHLKVNPAGLDGAAFSNIFEVKNRTEYLLEFDVRADKNITVRIAMNKIEAPYSDLFVRPLWISTEWQHYAIPVNSDISASDMRLNFYVSDNQGDFYLDNIEFTEVKLGRMPLRSHIAFNKKESKRSIDIPAGIWEDLDGNVYSGSISLQPFTSKILIVSDKTVGIINAKAGEDIEICKGESATLTASGGSDYLWSNGETTQSITVNPNETTNYIVTVSDGNLSANDSVEVMVKSVIANAGSDKTIFEGESITLTASGGDDYEWNTGATTASITVNPTGTKTYTVTVTKNGCDDTDRVKVIVNPITTPTTVVANAGVDVAICSEESTNLTASGGSTYLWSTGATTASITVSPNTTKTYTVTATDGSSNSDSDDVLVTVTSVTANAGVDKMINIGETIKLTASGGDTYLWSTGQTTKSITVTPSTTNNYTVTVYKNGCHDTDEISVFVAYEITNPPPADAFAGDDISICLGESITLNASGGDTYTWSTGDSNTNIDVNPTRTTTYTLTATRGGITDMDTVTVSVENCNISAIPEDISLSEITIYPNPTTGLVSINVPDLSSDMNVELISSNGSLVYKETLNKKSNGFSKIDLSRRLAKGVYFVRLFNTDQYFVKKIIFN